MAVSKPSLTCEFESEVDKQAASYVSFLSPPSPANSTSSMKKMDSQNIESENVDDLNVQPLKRAKIFKSCDFDPELDKQAASCDVSPSPPSPSSMSMDVQFKDDQTYDYLPQDYTMTDRDLCAQIAIETSSPDDILVKIDDIFVKQEQLLCLLDSSKFLNDDVISAYICCMKDQVYLQNRNNFKVYFENPFVTTLFKRDGKLGVNKKGTFLTEIVKNYLNHGMVLLPINIEKTHWYLAIVNAQNCEIQVLDSLCWDFNRSDLTSTLQGIQNHLNILQHQQDLNTHNWEDFNITTWIVTEEIQQPIQKDDSSCGLFMLKFMEYWSGDALSHNITQENIDDFRFKLAGILLCWKRNTTTIILKSDAENLIGEKSNDVPALKIPNDQNGFKTLSKETKYQSLLSVLSKMSAQELVGGLCSYIKSINCAETLEKVWIGNSKPFFIGLTVRKLQEILNENCPMDHNCFNLIIRKFMFDFVHQMKKTKGMISKHYLDLRFWTITDFGRHPDFRKKLDVEQLAESICSWSGLDYNVSKCKSILIPIAQSNSAFILFILNKDTRTVYILDPTPLDPIYKYNPSARYTKRILWLAEYLPKAMAKVCPGSTWNEDFFLWRQIILTDIPTYNRELSGYLVSLFMCGWKDEQLQIPVLKDAYEVRKQILAHLLIYKENNYKDNMPLGVQDLLRCINAES